jgi:hypothetical protein
MTGKHLSFWPGNGRRWAVFRPMVRNGKRTQFRSSNRFVWFTESGRPFMKCGERGWLLV